MIKALLAAAGGALSTWGKAIGAVFGFGQVVAQEVHDSNERVAGENKVLAQGNADAARVNADVAKAAVATTDAAALGKLLDASG